MVYAFQGLELDDAVFELRRGAETLPVQPKVLALLLYLVSHRDRTVPKQELFEALWPGEAVGESSLTRAVRGARRALGDDGDAQTVIRAVRGVGYRFVADVEERDIRTAAAAASPAAARAPAPAPARPVTAPDASLVGREELIAALEAQLDAALVGGARFSALLGPPGIGKTRLAEELGRRAAGRQVEVLVGRCFEGDGAPAFWPWVQIVRAYARARTPDQLRDALGPGAADIAQAIPELAEQLPDLTPPPAIDPLQLRFRLHDSTAAFLRRAAAERPLLLVIDDLHCADRPSLRLLQFVLRELRDAPLLLLGTLRDAPQPDADATRLLDEIARDERAASFELAGLDIDDVRRFVALATDEAVDEAVVASLHERTGGNPLFLGQLLAVGAHRCEPTPPAPAAVAKGVRDAIRRHLEGLSDACQAVLRTAAVAGREFSLRPLAVACDSSPAEMLERLGEAIGARVIEESVERAGRYRFAHGLIPEVLYAELPPAERVRRHAVLGDALAAHYGADDGPHVAELAHHFLQAAPLGQSERAVQLATRAADRAVAQTAYEEAARWYERALDAFEFGEPDAERRVDLLLRAGAALYAASEFEPARDCDRRALEVARSTGAGRLFARAALGGARQDDQTGRVDPTRVAVLEEALERLEPGDDVLRVLLLGRLSDALYFAGSRERVVGLSREAVEMARRVGDRAALVSALRHYHFALSAPDTLAQRRPVADEIQSIAEASGDRVLRAYAHISGIESALELGDRDWLDREVEGHAALARELRHPYLLWEVEIHQAMRTLLSGRLDEAEQQIQTALEVGMRIQPELALQWFGVQIYPIRRETGRLGELEPEVRSLIERYPAIHSWRAALALMEAEDGREDAARRRLRALATGNCRQVRRDINFLITLAVSAECCAALGDAEAAGEIYPALLPYASLHVPIGPAVAGYGSVSRYLGLLAWTRGELDAGVAHLEAALRADQAMGAAGFAAHESHELGRLLVERGRAGDAERARELVREAAQAARDLGMSRLAARVGPLHAELQGAIPLARRRKRS